MSGIAALGKTLSIISVTGRNNNSGAPQPFSSPANSLNAANIINLNQIPVLSLTNNSATTADNAKTHEEKKDEIQELINALAPWKNNPLGFGVDILFSFITYVLTYNLLNMHGTHLWKIHNPKTNKPELLLEVLKNYLPKDISHETFENAKKSLITYNPAAFHETFNKAIKPASIELAKELNAGDRLKLKAFSIIYHDRRRTIFAVTVAALSLARALFVKGDLGLFVSSYVFFAPLVINYFFHRADKAFIREIERGNHSLDALVNPETARGIANNARDKIKGESDLSELICFWGKATGKAAKRMVEGDLVQGVITLVGSVGSRVSRDSGEDGSVEAFRENKRNPVLRFVGGLPPVKVLNKWIVENTEPNSTLRKGFLPDIDAPFGKPEELNKQIVINSVIKTAIKYVCDFFIFGFISSGLIKIMKSIQWALGIDEISEKDDDKKTNKAPTKKNEPTYKNPINIAFPGISGLSTGGLTSVNN
jgi:hypothetical protein